MFSNRLNEVRHARGLTAQQMADHLGMELRSYRNYESGNRQPALATLVAIADYLDVSVDYLLCRDEYMARKGRKE